ncbi:hypothetical protein VCRA2110O318_110108 [Vibrio crassostreae]|nr:hypothetical protein VCRA2117O328_60107 [Vibrio crassostreae]CAK2249791.1 hypothetical protein VCRA2110O318_110108 [Vibrio crassostreae]CAK2400784.1 hypothetical protein VCRA2110O319_110109 [Vibrio crassostreae]CAK2588163.1 hypothetical protein VCRA217O317_110032 [Vibrio crassostreae]
MLTLRLIKLLFLNNLIVRLICFRFKVNWLANVYMYYNISNKLSVCLIYKILIITVTNMLQLGVILRWNSR